MRGCRADALARGRRADGRGLRLQRGDRRAEVVRERGDVALLLALLDDAVTFRLVDEQEDRRREANLEDDRGEERPPVGDMFGHQLEREDSSGAAEDRLVEEIQAVAYAERGGHERPGVVADEVEDECVDPHLR